jgi:hypothetical protein
MIYSPAQKKPLGSRYTPSSTGLVAQAMKSYPKAEVFTNTPMGLAPGQIAGYQTPKTAPTSLDAAKTNFQAPAPHGLPSVPGAAPRVPATTPPSNDYWADAQKAFQGVMADDEKSWQGQQQMLQQQMNQFMVQSDSMNARMGGSLAGGSAGLSGVALSQGMRAYNDAAQDYANRRRQTQLAWLDQQIEHGQRQEEHGWALNDPMTLAAIQQMIYQETGEVPSAEATKHMQAGGGLSETSEERGDYYADMFNSDQSWADGTTLDASQIQQIQQMYETWRATGDDAVLYEIEKMIEGAGGDFVRYSEQDK